MILLPESRFKRFTVFCCWFVFYLGRRSVGHCWGARRGVGLEVGPGSRDPWVFPAATLWAAPLPAWRPRYAGNATGRGHPNAERWPAGGPLGWFARPAVAVSVRCENAGVSPAGSREGFVGAVALPLPRFLSNAFCGRCSGPFRRSTSAGQRPAGWVRAAREIQTGCASVGLGFREEPQKNVKTWAERKGHSLRPVTGLKTCSPPTERGIGRRSEEHGCYIGGGGGGGGGGRGWGHRRGGHMDRGPACAAVDPSQGLGPGLHEVLDLKSSTELRPMYHADHQAHRGLHHCAGCRSRLSRPGGRREPLDRWDHVASGGRWPKYPAIPQEPGRRLGL